MKFPSRCEHWTGIMLALALTGWLPAAAPGSGKGGNGQGASASEHGNANKGAKGAKTGRAKTSGELLEKNTQLASKLQGLLPSGTDLQQAAAGFKNLGQFVAAVHVSRNLGISFDQLKAQMVDSRLSLGQAIQKLKPAAASRTEARKGENEAALDLQ